MADYTPVDLTTHRNAGVELLEAGETPYIGHQSLRGLPFAIGDDSARAFVALGANDSPVSIQIDRPARTVLVAHRLLETRIPDNGPLGVHVADYTFALADGSSHVAPIRERFEIMRARPMWGEVPFASVPDQNDVLSPRYEGRFDEAGTRQSEADYSRPRSYLLWVWTNPRPDVAVQSLTITPCGPRFLVAAVTVGTVDEHPFVRRGARPVKVTLTEPAVADRKFDLAVTVDRGVATYPYPLPRQSVEEYLGDPQAAFGQARNELNSPAYVQIAATPSATVTITAADDTIADIAWGELEQKYVVETPRARIELLDTGRNWVHTTVLDADTGRPVPCRVHFRTPDGVPYQPHGHHAHVNSDMGTWHVDVGGDVRLGQASYAYTDGTCQGWLPRGEVIVDVARGFEYEPIRQRVTIAPGQRELTLTLKRWTDMNARRWFSGDTHVHFLSTQGSQLEARGEDLNVVNLLLSQWGHLFTNTEEFTGEPVTSRDGKTIVWATQENRQHFLGHLTLLGVKKPIMPWCSDGPDEAEMGGTLEITMSDWADQCRSQGGTVVIPHLPNPNGEPATLIATGRADAAEMLILGRYNHGEYYRYLNCGYRLPLVGGTDKMTSDVPVGLYRTYVHIPDDQPFTYDTWCANLRAGRTFLSGGPIIDLKVDGHSVGDTVRLPGNGGTVEVEATVESIFPVHTLELVQQGKVVATAEDSGGVRRLNIRTTLRVTGDTWLAARAGGPGYFDGFAHHDGWARQLMAHTSPIYVTTGVDWDMFDQDAAQYMLTLIDGNLTYIRDVALHDAPGSVTHHHHHDDHLAYLEEPFHQARAAIHRRMHQLGIAH